MTTTTHERPTTEELAGAVVDAVHAFYEAAGTELQPYELLGVEAAFRCAMILLRQDVVDEVLARRAAKR